MIGSARWELPRHRLLHRAQRRPRAAARATRAGCAAAFIAAALLAGGCGGDPLTSAGEFTTTEPGVLVVATSLPAPGFWEGEPDAPTGGFEFGLAEAIMARFDIDELRVIDVAFTDLIAGDLHGADLALAQITPTDDRAEVLDFTIAYLDADPAVLVRTGEGMRDVAEAKSRRWVAQRGTTDAAIIDELIAPDEPPLLVDDTAAVIAALDDGSADAAMIDLPTALVEEVLGAGAYEVNAQIATGDGLAIALPEGSDDIEALDAAIRAFITDGTLDELADEWLGRGLDGSLLDIPVIRTRPAE